MVPNIDGTMGHKIKSRKRQRHGSQCVIQYPTNKNPAQSLQENAIIVFGPRLYNSLPKNLRDIESVKTEKFKFELVKFLELIPDEPKMPNYVTASWSNSILDQLTHLRARGIYQSDGVLPQWRQELTQLRLELTQLLHELTQLRLELTQLRQILVQLTYIHIYIYIYIYKLHLHLH